MFLKINLNNLKSKAFEYYFNTVDYLKMITIISYLGIITHTHIVTQINEEQIVFWNYIGFYDDIQV